MTTQNTRSVTRIFAAGACLTLSALGTITSAATPIRVTVNGSPIAFGGTQPTEVSGSVLVPLRGVFEALGASVDYNTYSRTINARKGATNVTLPVGATTATVNGQSQALSQPAEVINGTTLVPLRFVAQALGAYVDWNAATSTVVIKTDIAQAAAPPPTRRTSSVAGELTSINTGIDPTRISIRVHGAVQSFPVSQDVRVLRSDSGQPEEHVGLEDLDPGMPVTLRTRADGAVVQINARYNSVRGVVKDLGRLGNGRRTLTFEDGTTVELIHAPRVIANGAPVNLSEIRPGRSVTIITNPNTNVGFVVLAQP